MKAVLCLLWILAGFTIISAQETVIQKSDFETIIKNATDILKAKPHRVTVTSKTNVNGKPQESTSAKTIVEVAATDKRRSVREYKSATQNSKREFIRFGDKTYSRENEGQWKQGGMQNSPSEGNLKTVAEQIQYESLGKEMLNNQNTNIYRRTKTGKMIDSSNNEEVLSTETVKYWFDESGALLKREMDRENRRAGKVFHFMVTALFDYDRNIQVVAPQIAGNQE